MQKYAVIDIGSNSVRLMFVANGKVLYKRLNTTRLGEGLANSPRLKAEAIERSATAVAQFYDQAKAEGAERVLAFATAAVRSAENGNEFTEKVKKLRPIDVEVISGETEAEIGVLGALGETDGAVIDMGGASTELVIKKSGKLTYKKSVNIGVVRLKDACDRDKNALVKTAEAAASAYGQVPALPLVHAIGGTATTLAAIKLGLQEYDSNKITGTVITAEELQKLADKLLLTEVEKIAKMPCMPKGRADVIAGGATALAILMQSLRIEKIVVSDRDNLEGYAVKKGLKV